MDYFRSGSKVAILFLAACFILGYFLIHAGQVRVMGETQEFKLLFSSVGNLKVDSPVTYSGLKVGQVVDIRPLSPEERKKYQRDIETLVRISKDVTLHEDSKVQVLSLGFLGEKYIELSPGGMDARPLKPGDALFGEVPKELTEVIGHFATEFDEMIPKIKDTVEKIHSSAANVDQVVDEIAKERKVQALLEDAKKVTSHINHILHENRKAIRETLQNADDFSGDLKGQFHEASPKIQKLLDQMNKAVEDLDAVLAGAKDWVHENTPGIHRTLQNLEEASEHAKAFLKILREEPWRLLSKPRPAPVQKGPQRGFSIYKKSVQEKTSD
ncbi:MAG: MCE family protein [Chlamydiae bacterium]|nr:MCE family protein [Chlamydiota bacterium]MBI3266060.1 MCE family protein [Chlamydiota bacterium]